MPHSRRITFPNARGEELAGRLELPEGEPRAWALFAHCFTCSKDVAAASRVSRALCARGFAVLRFDFTGLGGSDGDFASTSFSSNVEDLVRAADHLRAEHGAPSLLIGHSLGGAAVLRAAEHIPEARAVATIGAPSDPRHVRELLAPALAEIEGRGVARVELAGRAFTIERRFLEDLERHDLEATVARLGRALFVLHAPEDELVGIEHAERIFAAARQPKAFAALAGADHLLSRPADAEWAAALIAAWASPLVGGGAGGAPAAADAADDAPAEGLVRVRSLGPGLAQEIRVGRHRLLADEPRGLGGEGRGPAPYDLLLAALGACTSMTLQLYARHKGWSLDEVSVELRHGRVHAEDCARCPEAEGKVDRIERRICVRGRFGTEERTRLLEIANRCPVHRTLDGVKEIPTLLADLSAPSGSTPP